MNQTMSVGPDFVRALELMHASRLNDVVIRRSPSSGRNVISMEDKTTGVSYFIELSDRNNIIDVILPVDRTNKIFKNIISTNKPPKAKKGEEAVEYDPLQFVTIERKLADSGRFNLIHVNNLYDNKIKIKTIFPKPLDSSRTIALSTEMNEEVLTENFLDIDKKDIAELMLDNNGTYFDLYLTHDLELRNIRFLEMNDTAEYTEYAMGDYSNLQPIRFKTAIFNGLSNMKNMEIYITYDEAPDGRRIYTLSLVNYCEDQRFITYASNITNSIV